MASLTTNVLVRNPDGNAEVLLEGSVLPDWAIGLVGEHALDGTPEPAESKDDKPASPYKPLKKDELQALIDERNASRDGASRITPEGANREHLIAALEADDQRAESTPDSSGNE